MIAAHLFGGGVRAADIPAPGADVPRPDAKPANMSKPVQVFLIMGQSNAVGMAPIPAGGKGVPLEKAVKEQKLYPFLIDDAGHWLERKDVRFTQVMVGRDGGMNVRFNDWLVPKTKTMGIEFGVGAKLGNALDDPVLILKSCIGNRALGWDLLPPNSQRSEYTMKEKKTGKPKTYLYAGYKDPTEKWEKGTEPAAGGKWYAGKQYDDDVANAKKVVADLDKHYPGANSYEVAGFFWWQGERDCGDEGHAAMYEKNLVNLIESLRKDFNAPHAKFVIATLGEAEKGSDGNKGLVLNAMLAVDGKSTKYPEFSGNVATVYTHDLARGGSGDGHYGFDSRVYMDIGLEMGDAMCKLLRDRSVR
jgi:hypothetical protein